MTANSLTGLGPSVQTSLFMTEKKTKNYPVSGEGHTTESVLLSYRLRRLLTCCICVHGYWTETVRRFGWLVSNFVATEQGQKRLLTDVRCFVCNRTVPEEAADAVASISSTVFMATEHGKGRFRTCCIFFMCVCLLFSSHQSWERHSWTVLESMLPRAGESCFIYCCVWSLKCSHRHTVYSQCVKTVPKCNNGDLKM